MDLCECTGEATRNLVISHDNVCPNCDRQITAVGKENQPSLETAQPLETNGIGMDSIILSISSNDMMI